VNKLRDIRVGYAPLKQPYFDQKWAKEIHQRSLALLRSLDGTRLIEPDGTITTEEDAQRAAAVFHKEAVDLVLMQCINADSGILASAIGQKSGAPILVWSTPEPTMHETSLVANSFCGAMIITGTLRRHNIKYKHLHGFPEDEGFKRNLERSIKVLGCISALTESKLGLVGYQSPGFHHVSFGEMLLRRTFGVRVQHIDLAELFAEAERLTKETVVKEVDKIKKEGIIARNVFEEDFQKTASIGLSLQKLAEKYEIGAFAVKCFPEFNELFKLAPCSAIGRTTDTGIMTACEGDMIGALTMLVEYYLTANPVFFVDLISMDEKSNTGVVWHCGNAPICMAEGPRKVRYEQHSILAQETPMGLTREFACKTGPVTCARISEREDEYYMYALGGKALEGDETLRGTSMTIKFYCQVKGITETLFEDGVENHFAVVYGDIRDQLEDFSKWLGIKCIAL